MHRWDCCESPRRPRTLQAPPTPRENAPAAIDLGSSGQAPAPPPPPAPLLPTGMSFPRRLRQAMVATRLLLTQLAAEERQGGGRQPGPLCSEVR